MSKFKSGYPTDKSLSGDSSTDVHSNAYSIPGKAPMTPPISKMENFRQRLEKAKAEQDQSYFITGEGKEAGVWCNLGKLTRLVGSFQRDGGPGIKKFWYSQDCTPENLVDNVSKSTLVAIDIGNHQSETAVDVGIAILPAFPDYLLDAPLKEGVAGLLKYGARIHNFCTPTQGPLPVTDFEPLRFGTEETLEIEEIEGALVKMLQQAKREAGGLGNELVLILFCAGGDLKAITRLFPKIVPLFTWWTDVQVIATKMVTGSADGDAPKRTSPSLGETLAALGHRNLCQGGTSRRLKKHKSSHDAARTLAVVAGVVRKLRAGEGLTIQERTNPKPTCTRKIHGCRPRPAELFPFVANIKMEKGICPSPREYRRCENLWDIFAAYEPNAVGRRIYHSRSTDWFNECKGGCGGCIWISVPTRALVEQLVKDFNGKQMKDGRLVVKDTSMPVEAALPKGCTDCEEGKQ
ncbi:hypothetical protein Daus18300_004953 [Diaporthe australafricana]|uniref:Uncharacterized protein n=1 Tax=Diaporthe australafricana TaxID=127596 RepID=A0ABR3X4I1_9PEZI